jgi:hypothetical protein
MKEENDAAREKTSTVSDPAVCAFESDTGRSDAAPPALAPDRPASVIRPASSLHTQPVKSAWTAERSAGRRN